MMSFKKRRARVVVHGSSELLCEDFGDIFGAFMRRVCDTGLIRLFPHPWCVESPKTSSYKSESQTGEGT